MGVLYEFFQYLIRAELYSDHEKLENTKPYLLMHWKLHVNEQTTKKP